MRGPRSAGVIVAFLLVPLLQGAFAEPTRAASFLDRDADGIDDALAKVEGRLDLLVRFERMPGDAEREAVARAGGLVTRSYAHFPVLAVSADASALAALARLASVALVETDDAIARQLKESVPLLGVPEARDTYEVDGDGVVVAIIDDGIYAEHPDLSDGFVERHDATPPPVPAPLPRVPLLDPLTRALDAPLSTGHGTHVAGIVAGPGTRSGGAYEGVAPGARFVDVKVFHDANDTQASVVLSGLDWILSERERLSIRIVLMSVGGRATDGSDSLSRAADAAVAEGLVVVSSAGNSGPDAGTISSPGSARDVITVGAVDKSKHIAAFSGRGPLEDGRLKPDVVAPGVAITSTVPPASLTSADAFLAAPSADGLFYGQLSGTSTAAPHVAGVIALMLDANPELAPADVKRILQGSAQDLGDPGPDGAHGHGFVNGLAAVQVASDPALLALPQFASLDDGGLTAASTDGGTAGTAALVAILLVAALAIAAAVGAIAWSRRR